MGLSLTSLIFLSHYYSTFHPSILKRESPYLEEIADKAREIIACSQVPLKQVEIAELLHCPAQYIAQLKSLRKIKLPPMRKREIKYIEKEASKTPPTRVYKMRQALSISPASLYSLVKKVDLDIFEETPLENYELDELFSLLKTNRAEDSNNRLTERTFATLALKGKSSEELMRKSGLSHEGARMYIYGLGLHPTIEAMKEEIGKEKLPAGINKRLPTKPH
ncbi:MAG: hypothetical protein AABW80_03980 [Nanoarchaeota archaeon]